MAITEELALDISAAQRKIDQLEAEITRAFAAAARALDVDVDTTGIANEITAAVSAADTTVELDPDTAGMTAQIDSAIDAADAGVEVTADAGRVTGAIDSAVDAADTTIEVDGRVSPGLQRDTAAVARNLAEAEVNARLLQRALGAISVGLAARGLYELADAASQLEQAVGGSEAVFGEAAGTITAFASTADEMAGLTEEAARTLTSQIGGLLKGFGFTREEAAKTSVVLAQLGADLAATFGGRPQDAVEALGAALRGEFNPLERFGVSLNVAQIEAYALANGLAASRNEIDLATRAQAALAIITERTADAQGQFGREAGTAAGALSIARAEAGNLAAAAGGLLQPAFLGLIDEIRSDVLPGLAELGEDVLPAVGDAIVNLTPLLGTATDVLVALAPTIEAIASVIGAIPPEVIAFAAALISLNVAINVFARLAGFAGTLASFAAATRTAALAIPVLTRALTGLQAALMVPGPVAAILALGTAITAVATASANGLDPIGAIGSQIIKLADSITGFGSRRENRGRSFVEDILGPGFDPSDLDQASAGLGRLRDELADLQEQEGKGRLFSLGDVNVFATGGDADRQERIDQLREQIEALEETAQAEIDAGLAARRFTEDQVEAALAATQFEDGTDNVIAALSRLRQEHERQERENERIIERYAGLGDQFIDTGRKMEILREEAPQVASAIADLRVSGEEGDQVFLRLAQALDEATLSEQGMAAAAALLGTDVDALKGFVEDATDALDDFVNTAVGGLPSVRDAFNDAFTTAQDAAAASAEQVRKAAEDRAQAIIDAANAAVEAAGDGMTSERARKIRDDAKARADAIRDAAATEAQAIQDSARITARGLTDALNEAADRIATFREDLRVIADAGFVEIAGMLAEQGADTAGSLATELRTALETGNTELLANLQAANENYKTEFSNTTAYIRDTLGPELIITTGLIGASAAEAFGEDLDFAERIRIAAELAKSGLDVNGQAIAAVAAVEGERAARAYGEALGLEKETIDAAVSAGLAIANNAPTEEARTSGKSVGSAFGEGMEEGISSIAQRVAATVRGLVFGAEREARTAAESRSPSRLFARVGADLGAGLAVGIDEQIDTVTRTVGSLVSAAAVAAAGTDLRVAVRPDVAALSTQPAGAAGIDYERLAAAVARALADMAFGPNITVNNPAAATAESSIRRELTAIEIARGKG